VRRAQNSTEANVRSGCDGQLERTCPPLPIRGPHGRGASLGPPQENVQVALEMFRGHRTLVSAEQPPFDQRSDAMDAR